MTLPPRIRILPPEVVAQIAAGEVIERPGSVAKELIENAIDAGARKVSVAVRGAPDRFLRVLDDGCGMTEEEAHLALKRHATSKLVNAEDLERVVTLGFRGEALPTIAQVSRLTLSTRSGTSLGGVQIEVAGGAILTAGPVGRPPGTAVTVADLFFNTPARRKFLRTGRGEMRIVTRIVSSYALILPGIHFLLSLDDQEVLNLPPVQGLRERALVLYGTELAENLVPVHYSNELVAVSGLVGSPDLHRGNRDHQTFFVNGRWVQNPLLGHAVRTAYRNRMPAGRHPFAALELELDPRFVDVNVHPTKREIKFSREHEVYSALVRAVDAAIRDVTLMLDPAGFVERTAGTEPPSLESFQYTLGRGHIHSVVRDADMPFHGSADDGEEIALEATDGNATEPSGPRGGPVTADRGLPAPAESGLPAVAGELVPLFQLHNTYILCPVKGGVLIVDQHVAHERILYERALNQLRERVAVAQTQLFPAVLDLPPADMDRMMEAIPFLTQIGFDLRAIGPGSIAVHATPSGLQRWDGGRFLVDFLDTLARERRAGTGLEEAVAASYACRAAVRKGDPLNLVEMNRLVEDLFACEVPLSCPHGRPIVVKLTLDDLDRRFGRA